jgi:hypothetical protein
MESIWSNNTSSLRKGFKNYLMFCGHFAYLIEESRIQLCVRKLNRFVQEGDPEPNPTED